MEKQLSSKYGPISLLSRMLKIFNEVYLQLTDYLKNNILLHDTVLENINDSTGLASFH